MPRPRGKKGRRRTGRPVNPPLPPTKQPSSKYIPPQPEQRYPYPHDPSDMDEPSGETHGQLAEPIAPLHPLLCGSEPSFPSGVESSQWNLQRALGDDLPRPESNKRHRTDSVGDDERGTPQPPIDRMVSSPALPSPSPSPGPSQRQFHHAASAYTPSLPTLAQPTPTTIGGSPVVTRLTSMHWGQGLVY